MFIKTYIVAVREDPYIRYQVSAPCKWVAKWCGANLANQRSTFAAQITAKDMVVLI